MVFLRILLLILFICVAHCWTSQVKNSLSRQRVKVSEKVAGASTSTNRDTVLLELVETARKFGPIGAFESEENQKVVRDLAYAVVKLSDAEPARFPLTGEYKLVYSDSKGTSSGKLFGNVYGSVTQSFLDDKTLVNAVAIGPVTISLTLDREILDGKTIKVSFRKTKIELFGTQLFEKEVTGGGIWNYLFIGKMTTPDGKEKVVRVMEAPSLFVLEKDL